MLLTEIYYNISKSIDWIKFINDSRCSVISSCLLAGQFPVLSTYCLRASRCVWSSVQFYRRWSVVWTPCLQTHVACSSILKRWRYALVFPCTVIIAAMEGVMLIFMFSLSWTEGKYCFVRAALGYFPIRFAIVVWLLPLLHSTMNFGDSVKCDIGDFTSWSFLG